jgi:hypothetical protein
VVGTAQGWSAWGDFGACDSACGAGLRQRERVCTGTSPVVTSEVTEACLGGAGASWGAWSPAGCVDAATRVWERHCEPACHGNCAEGAAEKQANCTWVSVGLEVRVRASGLALSAEALASAVPLNASSGLLTSSLRGAARSAGVDPDEVGSVVPTAFNSSALVFEGSVALVPELQANVEQHLHNRTVLVTVGGVAVEVTFLLVSAAGGGVFPGTADNGQASSSGSSATLGPALGAAAGVLGALAALVLLLLRYRRGRTAPAATVAPDVQMLDDPGAFGMYANPGFTGRDEMRYDLPQLATPPAYNTQSWADDAGRGVLPSSEAASLGHNAVGRSTSPGSYDAPLLRVASRNENRHRLPGRQPHTAAVLLGPRGSGALTVDRDYITLAEEGPAEQQDYLCVV